jgi:hypothetical protein
MSTVLQYGNETQCPSNCLLLYPCNVTTYKTHFSLLINNCQSTRPLQTIASSYYNTSDISCPWRKPSTAISLVIRKAQTGFSVLEEANLHWHSTFSGSKFSPLVVFKSIRNSRWFVTREHWNFRGQKLVPTGKHSCFILWRSLVQISAWRQAILIETFRYFTH